jgi:drug/metabolite transporter (DMT)-like permease
MAPGQQLSHRGAVLMGLLFIVVGSVPIVIGSGLVSGTSIAGTPAWVVLSAGAIFVLGGLAVIVGFAVAGGAGPDGDLPVETPFVVRLAQYLLGFGIVGLLTAIFAWIAFGPGERHFSSTLWSAFGARSAAASEREGRVVFGAATVGCAIFWAVGTVVNIRRLLKARRQETPEPAATVREGIGR